jgi:hypothetical protein
MERDDNKELDENRDKPPPAGNNKQGKAPSVGSTHWSEVPTNVIVLTKVLERKEVVFQKKMNNVIKARQKGAPGNVGNISRSSQQKSHPS